MPVKVLVVDENYLQRLEATETGLFTMDKNCNRLLPRYSRQKVGPMPRNFKGVLLRWLDLSQIFVWTKESSFNAPAVPA